MPDLVLTAAQLAGLTAAAREPGPLALLRAADHLARALTGSALCTAMAFDAAAMTVCRLYSSNPASYPVGGGKPKRDTAWGRHVLLERRVFRGEGEAAIQAYFDDHATILGLGLRSIVNVPVLLGGACVGTLNLSWPAAALRPEWVALAELLGLVVAPAWMASA